MAFLKRNNDEVKTNDIPPTNWDQTGSKIVQVSSWSMTEEGSRQVSVVGMEDKHEITVLLPVTASGVLLSL